MEEFIALIEKMRENQTGLFKAEYGSDIKRAYLNASRKLEKQVDKFIKEYNSPQKKLFDEE